MISIFLAGLWPMLWHLSGAGLIIVAALAWAWFMPMFKREALFVALAAFLTTTAYVVGVKDEKYRWEAVIAADRAAADKAARDADKLCATSDCVRNDPNNRDR